MPKLINSMNSSNNQTMLDSNCLHYVMTIHIKELISFNSPSNVNEVMMI
jgi:hypothetical protein